MNRVIAVTGVVLFLALPSLAQVPTVLTLESALERARSSAPEVVAARMRIEESRARLAGASRLSASNPTVEAAAGRRTGDATGSSQYEFEIAQDLELPSRRRARIDGARAAVTQEEQRARDVEREALRAVATAFLRAVEARERAGIAARSKTFADDAMRIADRRFAAGDVAQLDVNLARSAVARAGIETRVSSATLAGCVTQLRVLLGIGAAEAITIEGSLREAVPLTIDTLSARASERADVLLLDAGIAEAEAESRFARTLRWPDFGVRGSWSHEEGDRIVLGGLGISLPIFHRGQEATALAAARLLRLRTERDARARAVEAEMRGAYSTYEALRAAVDDYERTVLPIVDENEALALESYEVGQIGLADLLAVRRDALDARRTFIDQLIEMRLAEIELRASAGVWK